MSQYRDPSLSARPCGCDPGCHWTCDWHKKEEAALASREAMEREQRQTQARVEDTRVERALHEQKQVAGNGVQEGFGSGATRSTSAGKIDFEGHINPEVQAYYGEYMNRHRIQRDGTERASDNWQKGIPVYRYVKSLIRHTFEFWRLWRGFVVVNPDSGKLFTLGEVLCAIRFNVDGILYEFLRNEGREALDSLRFVPGDIRVLLENQDKEPASVPKVEEPSKPACNTPRRTDPQYQTGEAAGPSRRQRFEGQDAYGNLRREGETFVCCGLPKRCGVFWCMQQHPDARKVETEPGSYDRIRGRERY